MQTGHDLVIERTRAWVTHAVVGLSLCPFAGAVLGQDRIRFAVSRAGDPDALAADLAEELRLLAAADPVRIETTLLIHPDVLADFLDFNDFLDRAESTIEALGLTGVIQVASFHPDFRFGDAKAGDVAHAIHRSPYPTLHLLREASVERAIDGWGDTDAIVEANNRRLAELGNAGWAALRRLWSPR